ncbi:MAG TPA: hypothetical protein VJU77_15415 [Chthoniobacterales bacterium]|nr:hypothetical protein [Chthoniobacterales bacterium]
MKTSIIVDSAGNLIGIGHSTPLSTEDKKSNVQMESGVIAQPGQTLHEVDVPEELLRLEGPHLLKGLLDLEPVKKSLSTLITAGQG